MTDKHEDLIKRLTDRESGVHFPRDILYEAADAIEELVADLSSARAALRDPDLMRGLFGAANGQAAQRWASFHADAIAAAQSDKGEGDE